MSDPIIRAVAALGVAWALLAAAPAGAEEKKDKKEAELEKVPEGWRDVAERLGGIDRSDTSMPWAELREFKNQYTLFHPTPRALRREFITDRPDKTINPVTVDAGHFQFETDLAIATIDRRLPANATGRRVSAGGAGGFEGAFPTTFERKDDFKFLFTNLRVGLLNNLELQVFARPFHYLRELPPAVPTQTFGWGDMRSLLKLNLWGNEGGATAACAVGFLDIPTGRPGLSTEFLEGGGLLAFLWRLPGKTYIGVELGGEFRSNPDTDGYHLEVPESLSVAYSFTKDLSMKVEFASVLTAAKATSWFGVVALAALYQLDDDFQFDVGINIGVTPNAPDWQPYLGLAKRF